MQVVKVEYATIEQQCIACRGIYGNANWEVGRNTSDCIEAGLLLEEQSELNEIKVRQLEMCLLVYEKFGGFRASLSNHGLDHWSHCKEALSWDDGEQWVSKAAQNGWSIRRMCQERKKSTEEKSTEEKPTTTDSEQDSEQLTASSPTPPMDSDDVVSTESQAVTAPSGDSSSGENPYETGVEYEDADSISKPDAQYQSSPCAGSNSGLEPAPPKVPFDGPLEKYVDDQFKKHLSPLVRALCKIRDKNGGAGEYFEKAYDNLNEFADALLEMRKGEQ